jgi:hypothetical protein
MRRLGPSGKPALLVCLRRHMGTGDDRYKRGKNQPVQSARHSVYLRSCLHVPLIMMK